VAGLRLRERGASTFSLHPLQTFADKRHGRRRNGPRHAIAGSDESADLIHPVPLRRRLGMRPFEVPEESPRRLPRPPAAMASNLLVALEESARGSWSIGLGIEGRGAKPLLAPLVLRTAAKLGRARPPPP